MDMGIWQITIFLEFIVLAGFVYRRVLIRYFPWVATTVLVSVLETIPLASIYRQGSDNDYYFAYYFCDLVNILLYIMSARECSNRGRFSCITFTIVIYLSVKSITYALMAFHRLDASFRLANDMRMLNIACYCVWGLTVWGYDVCGIKLQRRK